MNTNFCGKTYLSPITPEITCTSVNKIQNVFISRIWSSRYRIWKLLTVKSLFFCKAVSFNTLNLSQNPKVKVSFFVLVELKFTVSSYFSQVVPELNQWQWGPQQVQPLPTRHHFCQVFWWENQFTTVYVLH